MAGVISESYLSRPFTLGKEPGRELIYDVVGTDDEIEVETLLKGTAPLVYRGLNLESLEAEPEGGGVWKGKAKYLRVEDNNEYTFRTTGGTQKVTQSLETAIYPGPYYANAPDFEGAIGVDGDRVEGVDIVIPAYEFSETHYIPDAVVTQAYKLVLFRMTGRMNNALFKGFASGEALFLGATGTKRGDEQWGITFDFVCSPNASSLTVGGIGGITKRGHDYLWVRYEDTEDSFAFVLTKRPTAVYVERVYEFGDFSTLLIGTT